MRLIRRIKNLFFEPKIVVRLRDPERLHQRKTDKAYSRNYNKYRKTYIYGGMGGNELANAQKDFLKKGKKVKYWRLVLSHDDFTFDEYIPIFSRRKKRKKR